MDNAAISSMLMNIRIFIKYLDEINSDLLNLKCIHNIVYRTNTYKSNYIKITYKIQIIHSPRFTGTRLK